MDLPPGDHAINFSCDAPKAEAPTDPRTMIFRIDRFHAEAEDLPSGRAETGRSQVSPLAGWGPGFYGQEVNGDDTWRWCQSKCEHFLENDGSLEVAQRIAGHADSRTTKVYDCRGQKVLLEDMERICY